MTQCFVGWWCNTLSIWTHKESHLTTQSLFKYNHPTPFQTMTTIKQRGDNSVPIKVYLVVFLANHRCPCARYCDDSRAILLCSRSCTIFCRRRDSISITVLPFCACGFSRSLTKYARVPTVKEKTISPVLFKATLQPLHFTVCFVADYAFTLRWDIGILQVLTWWKGWRKDSRAAARIVNSSQKSDMSCILWEYQ